MRSEAGEPGCYLKGYAYMLRTQENEGLIAEIAGGIKKEVSVSCAVSRCVCSICGHDIHDRGLCSHVKGRTYEGKRCIARLADPTDAFEWSFVAVPAQPRAGVVKGFREAGTLEQLLSSLDQEGPWREELKALRRQAEMGRRYLDGLRQGRAWGVRPCGPLPIGWKSRSWNSCGPAMPGGWRKSCPCRCSCGTTGERRARRQTTGPL